MSASRKKTILIVAIVLCIAGLWLLLWHRIGDSVSEAEVSAAYAQFTFADAYYEECDLRVVQLYDSAVTAIDNTDVTERTVELEDGTRAELFEYADGRAFMMWADSKYRYKISADSISGDEIIRIADSIK